MESSSANTHGDHAWSLGLLWVGATCVAGAVCWGAVALARSFGILALVLLLGALVGLAQQWVMRRFLEMPLPSAGANNWAMTTSLGWWVGLVMFAVVAAASGDSRGITQYIFVAFGVVMAGLIFGSCQWSSMKKNAPGGALWTLVNCVGWALGALVGDAVGNTLRATMPVGERGGLFDSSFEDFVCLAAGGMTATLVVAAITGVTFAWLAHRHSRHAGILA